MDLLKKIDMILFEEMKIRFWNMLIDEINQKFGSRLSKELSMMLRQDKQTGQHFIMMVNTFHEFPKAFLEIVKKAVKAGEMPQYKEKYNFYIDEKNRKITLSDENWKKVYRAVKMAK